MKHNFVPRAVLDRIKKEIDLLALVRERVELGANGSEWRGHCPFHARRRSASFVVVPGRGAFRCFSCAAEGDAIAFVMKAKGCTFREAVAILAARLDPPVDAGLAALEQATGFFERMLWEESGAAPARAHLARRGIKPDTARNWRIGYAPRGWTTLTDLLQGEGFSAGVLEAAGLCVRRTDGKGYIDRFRGRLMIPIRRAGQAIAFGSRVLVDGDGPKYLNSPESEQFKKGEILFGLDEARAVLASGEPAVVVEGYFDAIALHQAGLRSAVAVCGSALTAAHLERIAEGRGRSVVFAFDGDAAGYDASVRAALAALSSGLDANVMELPKGVDPDELLQREGAEAFRARLREAASALQFLIDHEFRVAGSNASIEQRVRALGRVAAIFDANNLNLDARSEQHLARLVGCRPETLRAHFAGSRDTSVKDADLLGRAAPLTEWE